MIAIWPLKVAMRLCYNLPRHFYLAFVHYDPPPTLLCIHLSFVVWMWPHFVSFGARIVRLMMNKRKKYYWWCLHYFICHCWKLRNGRRFGSKNIGRRPQVITTLWYTRSFPSCLRMHVYAHVRVFVFCAICAHLICFAFTRMESYLRSAESICII